MTEVPETRYAWNGEVSLAFQVVGEGPIDLLYLQYPSHVDLNWEGPALGSFLRALASCARLIITDRRGLGCSDRFSPVDVAPLETVTEDLLCVLEAAGSKRAVIFGVQDCAFNAALFAATYPARTQALILCDAFATYESAWIDDSESFGAALDRPLVDEAFEDNVRLIREQWGRPSWVAHWPSRQEASWFTRYARAALPPGGMIAEMQRYRGVDLRAIYPTIHVPALVLGPRGDAPMALEASARFLAAAIPESRLALHSLEDPRLWRHWYRRSAPIISDVGRFLASLREADASLRRVLTTVLFTDIVASTDSLTRIGDDAWRRLLERHHAIVRPIVARYGGSEVDTIGDGLFATFDAPGRAIRAAQSIVAGVRSLGVDVRAGLHTGECELIDGKPGGLAVHVGSRIAASAAPSEVLVSDTVRSLVAGSAISFSDRGVHRLKGIPDDWRLWAVIE